jgi:hypothetical protein
VTPNELAFLALGLVFGIASGAAILVIAGIRPPTHEIRLTVTRDAIPRRASTLAADAIVGTFDAPAPGGPGDRRSVDRQADATRTIVRSPVPAGPPAPTYAPVLPAPLRPTTAVGVAIAIEPEVEPLPGDLTATSGAPSLELVLGGDHRAMLRLVDAVAGADGEARRAWEELLTAFVEAARARAIDLGFVDLPMGNPFWDTFTIDQCREIVTALASTGRRFDGHGSWADAIVPTYRDLSQALADCGLDPRRIRAWPNSAEIAELFRGARVATAEAVAMTAPRLDPEELQAFLGDRGSGLEPLWSVWDVVRGTVEVPTA